MIEKRMGKKRIIEEKGEGKNGVEYEKVEERLGMKCIVYVGEREVERKKKNVLRMKMIGEEVKKVYEGNGKMKEEMKEEMSEWVKNVEDKY